MSNYYNLNFQMMQHHKYSLTEIENMIPWERDIYVHLLKNFVEEENKRIEAENAKIKTAANKKKR
jgi:DNA replication initiation complex subunit (GINS family)